MRLLFTFTFLIYTVNSFSYEGYKVYQVTPSTTAEADVLKNFENDANVDFWSELRYLNTPVDIMVSPYGQSKFEESLTNENIEFVTIIDNVEEKFQQQSVKRRRVARLETGDVTFDEYMRHDEILAYLFALATKYPNIVRLEVIGKSFEGRDVTVVWISSGGSNKPIIFAEAAIHAREWVAPPVALYIIQQLVEYNNTEMYRDFDWAILPVVNPDGYEFTHDDTRLWRKTRTPGTVCYGVDGNRNFDIYWSEPGASSWQCTQTYHGHSAFSEVEVRAVGNFFLQHKGNIKLYLDIHSYGPWILHPWGYTSEPVDNVDELRELGERVKQAILAVRGTNYTVGSSNELLYVSSGGSRDFAKAVGEVDLSYTIELPGGGPAGFDPDASEIWPIVTETWEGIKVYFEYVRDKFISPED